MTEEERTDVEEKVNEALVHNFENCEIAESPFLNKDIVKSNTDSATSNPVVASGDAKSTEVEEKAMEDEEAESDSDEDCDHIDEDKAEAKAEKDPTNLQLAWEVLELSKLNQIAMRIVTILTRTKPKRRP